MTCRWVVQRIVMVLASALMPAMAYAQASIAGVVKDTSGAVLPGVTVEASSPVLIEKVRSVVSDGTGQYQIVDLRPGTYVVTFTLGGFNAVRREGIELIGSFAATVNAEMKVGAVSETITVKGELESPSLLACGIETIFKRLHHSILLFCHTISLLSIFVLSYLERSIFKSVTSSYSQLLIGIWKSGEV